MVESQHGFLSETRQWVEKEASPLRPKTKCLVVNKKEMRICSELETSGLRVGLESRGHLW